ncbi:MAG: heterodisulfide reductase-related iron-sulfur binding cluster [Acidobacteriota bacterium]
MASAFDTHHPPAPELIDQCVHCGFCLPACPTYVLWGQEMDSPRGRIYLIKMANEGTATMTPQWVQHFDSCLGCMSCMTACPSGVDYGKLIEATRAQIERKHPRSLAERIHRRAIFDLFPNVARLRQMRPLLRFYQRSGVQGLLRGLGLFKVLPKRLRTMEALLPPLGEHHEIPAVTPAQGAKRKRVGLLLGCVQREFLSEVNAATVRVLAAEGCEVVAPPSQGCCGALLVHAGEEAPALELAKRVIDEFEKADVDVVITNAGGCGSNVREYAHQLRDDPQYAARAQRFSAKCRDVAEFLSAIGPRAPRHPLKARVAYHDSCHLQHAQRVRTQPRELLAAIPQAEIVDIPEAAICCGSAGIYNMVQPETATTLADRKADWIVPLQADFVATGNPGCLLQLQSALQRKGETTRVLHTIQLLDASIRGIEP